MYSRRPGRVVGLGIKRLADMVICLALLLLLFPLLVVIGLAVRMTSPGPIFFVQRRVGLGGREFKIIKFRTMACRPPDQQAKVWTRDDEARITGLGRFLRDYGLDELPQLINIMRGDMSIIGPRPPLAIQVAGLTESQRRMFEMRPGVLSLAAVRGRRSIRVEQRIDLHCYYVEHWSLSLDLSILWGSLWVVLRGSDAAESTPQ